jgi:hypothetical protein
MSVSRFNYCSFLGRSVPRTVSHVSTLFLGPTSREGGRSQELFKKLRPFIHPSLSLSLARLSVPKPPAITDYSPEDLPPQSLQRLLIWLCLQREAPPHSMHWLLCRLCWQMEAPPHGMHLLLCRLCSQTEEPLHSMHVLRTRLCSQMEAPPHSMHLVLRLPCGRERVLFIGTQFSILYTSMYSPA